MLPFKYSTKFLFIVLFTIATTVLIYLYISKLTWTSKFSFRKHYNLVHYHNLLTGKYLIEPVKLCDWRPNTIIIVTSYVGHVELRSAHRQAMSQEYLKRFNTTRIFLLAQIPTSEKYIKQQSISDESNTFNDILQGSFIENYKNLTYKHIMGLHWASEKCNQSMYIIKVDDDTVFNFEQTHQFLMQQKFSEKDILLGYILNNTKPRRSKQNKWYVSLSEYPLPEYPPYLSGWFYITNPYTAERLYKAASYHNYFWIDDILITGIIAKTLNIELQQLPQGFWLEYYELLECCIKDMIQRHIKCQYNVGPNGGRNNLILEYYEAYKQCENSGNCTAKLDKKPLRQTCILFRDRTIFSNGQPKVDKIRLK